jgi:hypothetical protein
MEDYTKRLERLRVLGEEYQANQSTFSLRGAQPGSQPGGDPQVIACAWADLTAEENQVLTTLWERSIQEKYSLSALAEYHADFCAWSKESDERHLAECADDNCEARVCRAERGLPPLTQKELHV